MEQSNSSKYYHANKDKFESYQENTPKIHCKVCGKDYRCNYYQEHLKCNMHKQRELKQLKKSYSLH